MIASGRAGQLHRKEFADLALAVGEGIEADTDFFEQREMKVGERRGLGVAVTGTVGGSFDLDMLIVNAGDVTANIITAESFTQSAGSGTTTLNNVLTVLIRKIRKQM